MKIGIMLGHYDQHGGGVRVYTHNLVRAMLSLDTPHEFLLVYRDPKWVGTYGNGSRVREIAVEGPSFWPGQDLIGGRLASFLWDQVAMRKLENRERLDVVFNPKYSVPLGVQCPTVFVCHGLDLYVMPSGARWFDRLNYYHMVPRYARKAGAIIAVSNTTREHVINYLRVNEQRVHTVYHGVEETFRKPVARQKLEDVRRTYRLPERFFLFCGQIYPPKNFGRLVQAYAQVGPKLGIPLVVAGKHTQTRLCGNEITQIERLGISSWVMQPGWVDHEALPSFYALAEALLMPSLYESFGLPLLEAMASGCPVVTANRYGTREVVDNAGILVDPEDVESIATGIRSVATDQELRHRLIAAGRERGGAFTWHQCALRTLKVLESVSA